MKQSTLFRSWGADGRKEPGRHPSTSRPASSVAAAHSSTNYQASETTDYEIPDDHFDNFFDDDFADEDLLQSYGGDVARAPSDDRPEPSSSSGGTGCSVDHRNLHQKTLAFHVGPSHSVLNSSVIEEDIPGFDSEAGELWIYPTNYPIRDYQFNIVQKALYTNTMVCLPTGLGKTFIAAVVMYNFYRWYPDGKIVFLAPTKPLVTQQIEACYRVTGIPLEHAAEMTGKNAPKERESLWESRRVFFLTPQVMQNDLTTGICPAHKVCCVVFDEAHRALGNFAYCQVVKELAKEEVRFRVLALSATPGSDMKAVQQVVTNLQIGHIELRTEDSFDIQRYVHERKVEKIVVPLEGEIADVKSTFLKVLERVVSRLKRYGVIYHSNAERMSKGQLLHARDQFNQNGGTVSGAPSGSVQSDFALSISLYHAYELLLQHGLRSFHQFLTTTFTEGGVQSRAKMEVLRAPEFIEMLRRLGERLGRGRGGVDGIDGASSSCGVVRRGNAKVVSPRFSITGAHQAPSPPTSFFYSHPKLNKLEEVVIEHFKSFEKTAAIDLTRPSKMSSVNTRVMIFSQYRESVQEISELLTRHSPLIRVMTFVGHGSGKSSSKGLTQKEQTEIVRKFREGGYNTLVSTCVGEEGLDIGEVDLIICFDAAKSPIRLVQRMGRTGRKRDGKIVMIVSEGKEDQAYNKSQSNKKSVHRAIKEGCKNLVFFKQCPRMVPRYISPQVHKMHMTIGEFISSRQGRKGTSTKSAKSSTGVAGQSRLTFGASKKKGGKSKCFLSNDELSCWSNELSLSDRAFRTLEKSVERCFPTQTEFLSMAKLKGESRKRSRDNSFVDLNTSSANSSLNSSASQMRRQFHLSLGRWSHCQTAPLPTAVVKHSTKSQQFTSTLEFIDLLNSAEGVGQCYDLEMETFLNREDVVRVGDKLDEEDKRSATDGSVLKKRKVGRLRRVIDDSSDEDCVPCEVKGCDGKGDVAESASIEAIVSGADDEVTGEEHLSEGEMEEGACGGPEESSGMSKGEKSDNAALLGYTASQHVVPRAPSLDSLDWLDEMEPSQLPSSLVSKDRNLSSQQHLTTSSKQLPNEEEFQFVTPKAPPSSRRSRIQSSTPITSTSCRKRMLSPLDDKLLQDTVDVFRDVPASAVDDDFSDTSFLSLSKREVDGGNETASEDRSRQLASVATRVSPQQMSILEASEVMERECVVIDSDSDEDKDGNGGRVMLERKKSLTNVLDASCTSDDSFLQVHGGRKKRPCKAVNHLLESPATPPTMSGANQSASVSPGSKENGKLVKKSSGEWLSTKQARKKDVSKKVTRFDLSYSSDEDQFDLPVLQRIKRKGKGVSKRSDSSSGSTAMNERNRRTRPRKRKLLDGFVEEEASCDEEGGETDPEQSHQLQDSGEYDMEDSFINDNSMLTQVSPSQRERVKSKSYKSANCVEGNMYLRSLMSPEDNLFGGRRGGNNQFRMVFSQRHQILNHYINKAGFNVADSAKRSSRPKRRRNDSVNDDDSLSEAEEVNRLYGDEDCPELSQSQSPCDNDFSSSRTSSCVSVEHGGVGGATPLAATSRKRRPRFLPDSDHDTSLPGHNDVAITATSNKRLRLSNSSSDRAEEGTARRETVPASDVVVRGHSQTSRTSSTIDRVVVSPSLMESIRIKKTEPCFSLGMDDWLVDIDLDSFSTRGEDPTNTAMKEVGGASERLLLSQEEAYMFDGDFHDSDTELL